MNEVAIPKPFMGQVTDASGEAVKSLLASLSAPASRTGVATCLAVTAIMGKLRVPFPVTLFTAIVLGDAAEKAYTRFMAREDVHPDGS